MEYISTRTKVLIACLAVFVYGAGLFVTVMDIDAAQYASMSCQMAASKDFWTALLKPAGYLDKPPLLFFLSALCFKVLGVSTVAYKLPTLLITVLGFYATYRLGKLLYGQRIGVLSAVILCSCEGIIFFTNDVRTDALLTGAVAFSVWQIAEFIQTGRARFFLGGCLGIGLAMLAKGPIGLMVPVLAIGSYLAGKRSFGMFFKWYWPIGGFIVILLLMPMLWGLYSQYGWHGIGFYFWTQSFGRITGQSPWHDTSGYFYFVHTFLWAFLPWMLLAYYSIGDHVAALVKSRFDAAHGNNMLLLGGTVFPFIALSCSHYKLPHYIFVIFPFVAILTAKTVFELVEKPQARKTCSVFINIQRVVCILMWVFALVCMTVFFPCANPIVWTLVMPSAVATFCFLSKKKPPIVRLVVPSVWAIVGFNLMMNVHFFPELLKFQGGSDAAVSIRNHNIPGDRLYCYGAHSHSIDFYTHRNLPILDSAGVFKTLQGNEVWVYTGQDEYRSIIRMGYSPHVVDSFPDVHVAKVTVKFLFFWSRPAVTGRQYLLHVVPASEGPKTYRAHGAAAVISRTDATPVSQHGVPTMKISLTFLAHRCNIVVES